MKPPELCVARHKFPCFRKDKFILCLLAGIGKVGGVSECIMLGQTSSQGNAS